MNVAKFILIMPPLLFAVHVAAQNFLATNSEEDTEYSRNDASRFAVANAAASAGARNAWREIPENTALHIVASYSLLELADPQRRAIWYKAYDLNPIKENKLKAVMKEFIATYRESQNLDGGESCDSYSKAQRADWTVENSAYGLAPTGSIRPETLYTSTIYAIRTHVSSTVAEAIESAVRNQMYDGKALNAVHNQSSAQLAANTCG